MTMLRVDRCEITRDLLVLRLRREEHVLGDDLAYQTYCRRVRWHLIPGVY